ncbi:uncharacterized protein BO87DRAFT_15309 [Aspergillus neoniger CBS 115656]|uniref:Uncharacterized protein n=1 Tax=Aspergillus neoniger (strain CBS 115656) TaxID=1448310 RepID=A0A318YN28_ASPNB|nr:hypothetical protein BO87DRAFT_15309 [Aspergillus neoniger CBS 115656]PYH36001.1 hypothetical protein BO87DRAFT_15309 [Aspergillus neoniger CBS 115656]
MMNMKMLASGTRPQLGKLHTLITHSGWRERTSLVQRIMISAHFSTLCHPPT